MPQEELAESIQWEAEQYIPFDINDVRLDYVVLAEGEPGRDNMDVLLVAVKRDKVNDYVSVISQTGKTPAIVDVDAFAVQNAYEVNYDLDPRKVVALINMGASVTNINILARGTTVFWRDITFGGNSVHGVAAARVQPLLRAGREPEARRGGGPLLAGRRPRRCSTRCRRRWRRRSARPSTSSRRPLRRGRSTSWSSPAAAP